MKIGFGESLLKGIIKVIRAGKPAKKKGERLKQRLMGGGPHLETRRKNHQWKRSGRIKRMHGGRARRIIF